MTEERERYIAGISKEERKIRFAIATEKSVMKLCKDSLATCNSSITLNANKKLIAKEKIIVKTLKKRLPAPRTIKTILVGRKTVQMMTCPNCGNYVRIFSDNYCATCGQKLR